MRVFSIAVVLCVFASIVSGQDEKKGAASKDAPKTAPAAKDLPRLKAQSRPPASAAPQPAIEDGKVKSYEAMEKQGWIYLFDGRPSSGKRKAEPLALWRVRNPDDPKRNFWKVIEENGELVLRNDLAKGEHGTDLISRIDLWDFELHVEFRVPPDSNSGVYLRGRYEIQINSLAPGKETKPSASDVGAIYNVREPLVNASKGPGEWQVLEARIQQFRVTGVRLNGELIHASVEIPEGKRAGTGSQLGSGDGASDDVNAPGPLFLQGDHGAVDFRNVRVRPRQAFARALPAQREPIREPKELAPAQKEPDAKSKTEK